MQQHMAWWSSQAAHPIIFLRPDVRVKTKRAIRVSSGNVTKIEKLSLPTLPGDN